MALREYKVSAKVDETKLQKSVEGVLSKQQYTVSVNAKTGELKQLKTEVVTATDAMGNLVTTTTKLNTNNEIVSQSMKTMTRESKSLGKSFIDTTAKVAKFYASTLVIQGFRKAMSESIEIIKSFNSVLTDFRKVSDLSGDSLSNYTQKLGEMGEAVARSRTEMLEASTEFKRSGYSDDESATLGQLASLYQNIADGQISAGESASFLISQMKAFNIETKDAISILDSVNKVSNEFAVSSSDLSSGLTKSSSALATYGNSLDETLGMLTAGTEIMTNQAGRVSRGLVSIGANIAKLADGTGKLQYEINGATKSIDLFDSTTGEMKNTYQVLSEISEGWKEMSNAEQTALGLSLAGKTQMAVFTNVMTNFDSAIKATATSMGSMGSAWEENEAYMDSIEAKTNKIKSAFEELVLGEGGTSSLIKGILDVTAGFLEFADDTELVTVALITLSGIILAKVVPSTILFLTNLKATAMQMILTTAETGSLAMGMKAVGISTSTASLAIGALTAVLAIGILAYNGIKSAQEEAIRKKQEFVDKTMSEISSLNTLKDKLSDENISRTTLDTIINENLNAYKSELEAIDDVNEKRIRAIELIDEEAKKKAELVLQTGLTGYEDAVNSESGSQSDFAYTPYSKMEDNITDAMKQAKGYEEVTKALNDYKDALIELREETRDGSFDFRQYTKEISKVESELSDLNSQHEENVNTIDKFENALSVLNKKYDTSTNKIVDMTEAEIEAKEAKEESNETQEKNIKTFEEEAGILDEVNKKYTESVNALSSMQKSYQTLTGVVQSYNSSGQFTLDSLSSLLSLGSEYISLLHIENGQLKINEKGTLALANSKIDEAQAQAVLKAQTELASIANSDLSDSMDDVEQSSYSVYDANLKASDGVRIAISACNDGTTAWNNYWNAMTNSYGVEKSATEVKQVEDNLKNTLKVLEDFRGTLGKSDNAIKTVTESTKNYEKATNKQTSALERQIEALKRQKEVLEEQKDAIQDNLDEYDRVFKYLSKSLDKEIEELEKNYKAWKKISDDKIKDIEERRDVEIKAIDKVIKKLKEHQDIASDDFDTQIKGIKDSETERLKEHEKLIDSLKEEEDARKEAYEAEKNRLSDLISETKDYYNDKIQAIKDENAILNENIKLQELEERVAKAKASRQMVWKDGGYQYVQDESAVSSAQGDLDKYKKELETQKRIEALEKERDAQVDAVQVQLDALNKYNEEAVKMYNNNIKELEKRNKSLKELYEKNLLELQDAKTKQIQLYEDEILKQEALRLRKEENAEKEIKILEREQASVTEKYDANIAKIDEYKARLELWTTEYQDEQDKILTMQKTGIDTEDENWMGRLENLTGFVDSYNKEQAKLADVNANIQSIDNSIKAVSDSLKQAEASAQSAMSALANYNSMSVSPKSFGGGGGGGSSGSVGGNKTYATYASGLTQAPSNGVAITGENPNKEIVIGSKLNNGEFTKLNRGDGVVNANSTKTLSGLLNSLSRSSSGGSVNAMTTNSNSSNVVQVHIDSLVTQIKDAPEFVDYFKDFSLSMIQKA